MKRAVWGILAIILVSTVLVSCGGGGSPTPGPITSGLTKRAFVSNNFTGTLDIVNAATDVIAGNRIILSAVNPTRMAMAPNKTLTLVFNQGSQTISVVSNATEEVAGSLILPDVTDSFFFLANNTTVYVAVRNVGQVVVWNTTAGSTQTLSVPGSRWMAASGDGKYVLVFSENSNSVTVIDTTAATLTPVVTAAGFDRPVAAVFLDNTTALVLSCGPQCGGTQASVIPLTLPANTLGAATNVPAATVGLLNGGNLYVAGTAPGYSCSATPLLPCGQLSVIATSTMTAAAPVDINDGFHDHMVLASGKLFIGAEFTCSAVAPNGCLTIFNTSSNTATIKPPCGLECGGLADVSGMTAISGRNVVYVIEGGELRIYDTATGALQTSPSVDIVGRAWDVVNPD